MNGPETRIKRNPKWVKILKNQNPDYPKSRIERNPDCVKIPKNQNPENQITKSQNLKKPKFQIAKIPINQNS